ncbi:DUF4177 domain-containing protein [Thermohalobacter berrensis]|uniref:DUF4177 domain-containing protein n=1 Tax=Thermohalobacter berrensis TaxID=99594 RepID=A0A419T516_9FIRM|nr:DUF4177 domain-containing protein [Thermohalobacter berrensis]RKD32581.1 hypothetical protein BET03_10930 [Thermohalobacter berrensis]
MEKFEYKIENLKVHGVTKLILTKEHEERLNTLGENGWELVQMFTTHNKRQVTAIFKRKKVE